MTASDDKIIIFNTVNNPRLDNNDLGPVKCDLCGCQTCAYLEIKNYTRVSTKDSYSMLLCAGCLWDGLNIVHKAILNSTKVVTR